MIVLHSIEGMTNSGNNFKGNVETDVDITTGVVKSNIYDDWEMFKDREPSFDDIIDLENEIARSLTDIVGFECRAQ